jgi:hypothetical protein
MNLKSPIDDGYTDPNFMKLQPITPEEFAMNPDYYTESNEVQLHKMKKEEVRQQFSEIISQNVWSNYQQFMNIINNSIKE